MTKFFFLDEIYPDAWAAGPHSTLDEWMNWSFGTSDFWDIALRAAGHESETHVLNYDPHWKVKLVEYNPDVVVSQNLSVWGAYEGSPLSEMRRFNPKLKLVGMCSYRCDDYVKKGWDCIFSSFRWMVDHCKSLGVRCEYLPLAFGRPVLDRIGELPKERDIPVAFIGGLGDKIWKQGTATMAAIAREMPEIFRWYGYWVGPEARPPELAHSYCGPAFGIDMYRILMRTKICLNRHGEIARKNGLLFGNNMRQYEALSLSCALLTDHSGELASGEHCLQYFNPDDAVQKAKKLLCDQSLLNRLAKAGQIECLSKHTYENRLSRFLDVIQSL